MTRLVIQWPDEARERVVAARGRLAVAGERLRARSFEDRLRAVAEVVSAWSSPDSPWRRELSAQLADTSPFHPDTLAEGLESALRSWNADRFVECARREIGAARPSEGLMLAPFECVSVLAGGSIPMPTLLSGLLPLVLGSTVLLRETSGDSVTAALLARSIAACDEDLARGVEILRFPAEDEEALDAFLASPCVVATGADATLAAIRSRLSVGQRYVPYAHRFSIAVLGPDSTADRAELERVARGLALDVARWDQSGCLSPVVVYLVDLPTSSRMRVARALAEGLEALSSTMPRGELSTAALATHASERAEARMRAAVTPEAALFEGRDFSVTLEAGPEPRPAPLTRFLRLMPVASLGELGRVLGPFSAHLSSAAVWGFTPQDLATLHAQLGQLGISRITSPGNLQTPPIDWPHDGMPLFLPMARFIQRDLQPLA